MKVFFVNSVSYGSTGRIMFSLADAVESRGYEALTTSGFSWRKEKRKNHFITSGLVEKFVHMQASRLTGWHGFFSAHATKKLIKKIEKFQPDVIHLHNLHGWYLNLPLFSSYLKESASAVIWTLHDCWSFTGHCPHFEMIGCEKWKKGCGQCPLYRGYPESLIDRSSELFEAKRLWFTEIQNLTVVAPSKWLAGKIEQSFLDCYPIAVVNNGIDLSVFRPCDKPSTKKNYGIRGSYVVLAVSYGWDDKKGLDVIYEVADSLPSGYQVVVVGMDKEDGEAPTSIVSIKRTHSQVELAEIYSMADVFVNPTREDTFPTVNMEALACGTPVVTFDTGGSPEIIDETCGVTVPKNDVGAMIDAVRRVCEKGVFSQEACLKRATLYSQESFLERYMKLYEDVA